MQTDSRPELPLYTYLVSFRGLLKIGKSHHPGKRRRCYGWDHISRENEQAASLLAVLPSNILTEDEALALFPQHRVEGREWFSDHPEIREYFESLRSQFVPEPWNRGGALFWLHDPRISERTRRRVGKLRYEPEKARVFRPIRQANR